MVGQCRWINPPAQWTLGPHSLAIVTDPETDFWRDARHEFTKHSGHLFAYDAPAKFTAAVRVRAGFETQYDQAGLMVLVDEAHWAKAGIEMSGGEALLSTVVTIGRSDWALAPFRGNSSDFWMRLMVNRGVLRVETSSDGQRWSLARLSAFPQIDRYLVGPMCCSPKREGMRAVFSDFSLAGASQQLIAAG